MKDIFKLLILYPLCMCFSVHAQVPGTPYILPGAATTSCVTTTATFGSCSTPVKGCGCVTGATKNDSLNTFGIEYDWTGGVGNLPNNVTHQALVEIGGQCWYRYNAKRAGINVISGLPNTPVMLTTGATDISAIVLTSGSGSWYYEGYLYQRSNKPQACPSGFRVATKADWIHLATNLTTWCDFNCNDVSLGVPSDDSLFAMLTPTWIYPSVRKSGLNLYGGGHYCNSCGYWLYSSVLYDFLNGAGGYSNIYLQTALWAGQVQRSPEFGNLCSRTPAGACPGPANCSTLRHIFSAYQVGSPESEEACTVRCVAN